MSVALRLDEVDTLKESLVDLKRQVAQLKKRNGAGTSVSDDGETATPTPSPVWAKDRFPSSGTLGSPATGVTLTYTPVDLSLDLKLNGLSLIEGDDYTVSLNEVTFTGASPTTGDVLEAHYQRTDATPSDAVVYGAALRVTATITANSHGDNLTVRALLPDSTTFDLPGVNTGATGVEHELGDWEYDTVVWRLIDNTIGFTWTEPNTAHIHKTATSGTGWTGFTMEFEDGGDTDFNDVIVQVRYYAVTP